MRHRGERLGYGEQLRVDLLGRAIPVVRTTDGQGVVINGRPGDPARIEKYLSGKFGHRLDDARAAMAELAAAYASADLYRRGVWLGGAVSPRGGAGQAGGGGMGGTGKG